MTVLLRELDLEPAPDPGGTPQGIDITSEQPKILTTEAVHASDVVITMGCGDTCPYYPGKRYEDWVLDDPPAETSTLSGGSATRSGNESKP